MERLKVLAWAVVLLVILAVALHMMTLFVIGGIAIAWRLVGAFAANPVPGGLVLLAAVSVGFIVGRVTDVTVPSGRQLGGSKKKKVSLSSLLVSPTRLA